MVHDVQLVSTIHTGFDATLNSSIYTLVILVYHCTVNQARGSHPYWSHNTQRMDEHGGKKTDTFSGSVFADGVWYTMSSNYMYRFWHPSQSINRYMNEANTPLHNQPSNGITSILATQYPKDIPLVRGWKLGHFHPQSQMVCDVPWTPIIHTSVDTTLNSSMCSWVRLMHHCTHNQVRGAHHMNPYGYVFMYITTSLIIFENITPYGSF